MAYDEITYADKVENNGATPAGRFGADDLNEIKTVTNANGASFDGRIGALESGTGTDVSQATVISAGSTEARKLTDRFADTVNVLDFGAVGDGVTDDTAAIQAAIDAWLTMRQTTGASLLFPTKTYRITDTLDFSSSGLERGEVLGGMGTFEVSTIIVDMNGYDNAAAFLFGDDTNPTSSQSEISISGFTFEKGASSLFQPVAIVGTRLAQSRISNIRLSSWNNVGISLATPQNCRMSNITLYSGGNSFLYKETSGITVSQAANTVTASSAIFSASDVGHYISVWGGSPNFLRIRLQVTGFTSPTVVTVAETETYASSAFYFDNPKVSINSGSNVLTADANCFSTSDVGLTIYVKKAGDRGRLLRSKIQSFVSPSSVRLDVNADETVNDVDFATPALELYTDSNASNGGSDNTFLNLQIEKHRSVGVISQNQDILEFLSTKIHSLQSNVSSSTYSQSPMWIDQTAGYYQGSFDAQYLGAEKVYAVYQTDCFNFESLSCRLARNEILLRIDGRAAGFEGGIIQIDDAAFKGTKPTSVITDLIVDSNTAPLGHVLSGKISYSEYDQTKVYMGNGVSAKDSVIFLTDSNGVTYELTVNTSGQLTLDGSPV